MPFNCCCCFVSHILTVLASATYATHSNFSSSISSFTSFVYFLLSTTMYFFYSIYLVPPLCAIKRCSRNTSASISANCLSHLNGAESWICDRCRTVTNWKLNTKWAERKTSWGRGNLFTLLQPQLIDAILLDDIDQPIQLIQLWYEIKAKAWMLCSLFWAFTPYLTARYSWLKLSLSPLSL